MLAPQRSNHLDSRFAPGIASETGLLQQALVHTPGMEMELVSPENRNDLLFEDILFVGHARKEHLLMCGVCEKIMGDSTGLVQVTTLLHDVFAQEDARHDFIEQLCAASPETNLRAFEGEFKRLSPEELYQFALTGQSPLAAVVSPIPNLMFTRDIASVVHEQIVLSHPAKTARVRESIIMGAILRHHPGFAASRNQIVTLPPGTTFEGGDLIVAGPNVVVVGHSERTSFGGIMALAQELFTRTSVEHVLLVDLPKNRSYMHLDTVFTFCTPDECVVFPPLFEGDEGNVVRFSRSDDPHRFYSEMRPSLKYALDEVLDNPLTFIPCGGNDPLSQRREQWTDGANFFAVAPGVVMGYERNRATFETMRRHGYRVVTAEGFLSYHEESEYAPGDKIAIKLAGMELSRGRGGPRCLTLPLARA
ncbi:MAG TPA: arginine deiminase family protein [Rhodothermales bacterium]|nr:arginine deiminase family protein [Rhodothermales bacterium]